VGVVVVTSGEVSGGDWTGPGSVGVCGGVVLVTGVDVCGAVVLVTSVCGAVVLVTGVDVCGATGAESLDGEETSKN
jgi:hypothetical protein